MLVKVRQNIIYGMRGIIGCIQNWFIYIYGFRGRYRQIWFAGIGIYTINSPRRLNHKLINSFIRFKRIFMMFKYCALLFACSVKAIIRNHTSIICNYTTQQQQHFLHITMYVVKVSLSIFTHLPTPFSLKVLSITFVYPHYL